MAAVKHVVLLKFKPGTTDDQIQSTFDTIKELKELLPGIEEFIGGPYSSPEGLNQGYTHGIIMTFADVASRDAYLPHAEHDRVKNLIFPLLDSVIAFDFEV